MLAHTAMIMGGGGEEKAQPGKQGETVKVKINQTLENVVGEA